MATAQNQSVSNDEQQSSSQTYR